MAGLLKVKVLFDAPTAEVDSAITLSYFWIFEEPFALLISLQTTRAELKPQVPSLVTLCCGFKLSLPSVEKTVQCALP